MIVYGFAASRLFQAVLVFDERIKFGIGFICWRVFLDDLIVLEN